MWEDSLKPTRLTKREQGPISGSFVEDEWASLNSVEITRNAKGETQWSVKKYHADLVRASEDAQEVYDALADKYGGEKAE